LSKAPLTRYAWPATAALLTIAGVISLRAVNENAVGSWGLWDVYPVLALLCVAGILILFVVALVGDKGAATLTVCLAGVLVLLHGSPTLIEQYPRFQVAWLHAAFIDHLATNGTLATNFDARFSWPGFFAAGATLVRVSGLDSAVTLLQWAPVLLVALSAVAVAAVTKALGASTRTVWMSALVFLLVDWVGQDYFAPQPTAYVITAAMLSLLLLAFRNRPPGMISKRLARWDPRWWPAVDPARGTADLAMPLPTRLVILLAAALSILAVVASHQLTPIAAGAALVLLALSGRLRPWPLALFTVVAFIGWLSYLGEPYWSGHVSNLFEDLFRPGQVVQSGVEQRVAGSPEHVLVLRVRMLFAVAVGVLGLAGLLLRWRGTGRLSVPALALAAAPAFIVLAGSYGGEGFLRIYYFSLLGLVPMVAWLAFPDGRRPGRLKTGLIAGAALLAVPTFLVARFGNESFERVGREEVQLAEQVKAQVPAGAVLLGLGDMATVQYQGLFIWDVIPAIPQLDDPAAVTVRDIRTATADYPGRVYVVATPSQIAAGEQNYGYPPDWARTVRDRLVGTGKFRIVAEVGEGFILESTS